MKYKSKPKIIEATQWFKNGDHPKDNCVMIEHSETKEMFLSEGKVVRYFRHPGTPGYAPCVSSIPCAFKMHDHGWIDTPEGGHNVCPSDFIITGLAGEMYPCKAEIFHKSYEALE